MGGVDGRGLSLGGQGFMSVSAGNYSKHRPFMGWLVVDAGSRGWGPPLEDQQSSLIFADVWTIRLYLNILGYNLLNTEMTP